MAMTKGGNGESWSESSKIVFSELLSATREHEVGITSNRGSARHGEIVPRPCTPRPSRSENSIHLKLLHFYQNSKSQLFLYLLSPLSLSREKRKIL